MPIPDDDPPPDPFGFFGYGGWVGYIVAAIVSGMIAGLYYLFAHL